MTNMIYTAEGSFLKKLFDDFNSENIDYAVMRNYKSLPGSAGGSDLDIIVAPSDFYRAQKKLLDCVKLTGGRILGVVQTWNFFEIYVIGLRDGVWWGVCVEIYCSISYKSAVRLIDLGVQKNIVARYNDIVIMREHYGNTLGLIKEIMVHDLFREDKPQYMESAGILSSMNSVLYRQVFSPLGMRALALLPKVVNSRSKSEMKEAIRSFRYAVCLNAFLSSPIGFFTKRIVHEFFRFGRYLRPPGTFIAILGVDGAGKSTVINAIKPSLDDATHNATFVQHLRPTLLPPLSRLRGKGAAHAGPVTEPHGATPSGVFGSLFRITYLSIDYILGYWIRTRPRIAKRPAIFIFDRYAYDMALDPRRFRIALPAIIIRWFISLVPKPDLIFCLYGNPEVLVSRKHELPLDEVVRQVAALKEFAASEPRAVLISTEDSVEVVRDQVLQAIASYCAERAAEHMHGP